MGAVVLDFIKSGLLRLLFLCFGKVGERSSRIYQSKKEGSLCLSFLSFMVLLSVASLLDVSNYEWHPTLLGSMETVGTKGRLIRIVCMR